MKKILIAGTVVALAASAVAQGELTQAWRIDGATKGWFPATVTAAVRTVRGAAYYPPTDKIVIVSRTTDPRLVSVDAVDGANDVENPFTASGGVFPVNMVGVSGDNIIYVCNLKNAAGEPYKLYRFATGPASTPTEAFNNADLGDAAITRVGDTLAVVGSGAGTEIFGGTNTNAGPHMVRLTTSDGLTFSVANRYTFTNGSFTAIGSAPARLGLAVLGTGATQQVWGDTSGPNDIPRKFNLGTQQVEAEVNNTVDPYLGIATTVGLIPLDGKVYLASGPGHYSNAAAPLVALEASRGRIFDVTTPATPTAFAVTSPLALQDSVPAFFPNTDGTGAVFSDVARRRVGFVLTNNSISMHNFPTAAVTDWNLF